MKDVDIREGANCKPRKGIVYNKVVIQGRVYYRRADYTGVASQNQDSRATSSEVCSKCVPGS